LSVAIAESPGSYAFFLGSGVSRDAGIPTGAEVFRQTVAALYRLEEATDETPNDDDLDAWLAKTGREDLNYSSLLELLAPSPEERRAYLASFFEGREPGQAHRLLAGLASQGLARVFVTTNFDRGFEQALIEVGVTPVVVTSDHDLAAAPAREHADVYLVKAHGDYLQQTIRNTEAELAELEPGITSEIQMIFDRYGLVVLGYSGSDAAIGACLAGRRSRYGLYWVNRSAEVPEPAKRLVEAGGGRVIARPDAADFLGDLARRLEVYRAHPSGDTPEFRNAQVIALLRSGDDVGLRELLKIERRAIMTAAQAGALERQGSVQYADLASLGEELAPLIERYLASVFPLIEHRSALWAEEVQAVAVLAGKRLLESGLVHWIELPGWIGWYIAYAAGGFAFAVDNVEACAPIFQASVPTDRRRQETLGTMKAGESGVEMGRGSMLVLEPQGQFRSPHFEHLVRMLAASDFLRSRYPEYAGDRDRVLDNLTGYNVLATLFAAREGTMVEGNWTTYGRGGETALVRLANDQGFRVRVAEVIGMDADDLERNAPSLLDAGSWKPGGYTVPSVDLIFRRD
jgi:hypothetical protein